MSTRPPLDIHQLRQRREELLERLTHVRLAAAISGAFALAGLAWVTADTGEWLEMAPYFAAAVAMIGLGAMVERQRSRLAAALLLINTGAAVVIRWAQTGRPGNLLVAAFLLFVYFRGLMATVDLADLPNPEDMPPA